MSDIKDLNSYVGKVYGRDFTKEDLQAAHPEFNSILILKPTTLTLAVAGFKPDRLRVWLNSEGEVLRIVAG